MIVEDKAYTLECANSISNKIMQLIVNEVGDLTGDPAEYFYLFLHVTAMVNAKAILSLLGYSEVYGINARYDELLAIISDITSEYLKANMGKIEEYKKNESH